MKIDYEQNDITMLDLVAWLVMILIFFLIIYFS